MIETIVEKHLESNDFEWKLKQRHPRSMGRYLFEQTKRRPVILPVIMEATQRRNKNKQKSDEPLIECSSCFLRKQIIFEYSILAFIQTIE